MLTLIPPTPTLAQPQRFAGLWPALRLARMAPDRRVWVFSHER